MAVVKANFIKRGRGEKERARATVRYMQHRPGRDNQRLTRALFGSDGHMDDFAIGSRPRVLTKVGPPFSLEPTVSAAGAAGGTPWIGDGRWSCLSSCVASTSLGSAPSRGWRGSLVFIGGWSGKHWPVPSRRTAAIGSGPDRRWAR